MGIKRALFMSELTKNQILPVVCDGYAADGCGVAHVDGMALFVSGAIAGERCRVRVLKVLKHMAFAKVEEIGEPSPERAAPGCPHYPACGGCAVRHMSYDEELRFKRQKVEDALRRVGGADLTVDIIHGAKQAERYRGKAQLPVSPGPRIGFYRGRSHEVIDVPDCRLEPESVGRARGAVLAWMRASGAAAYDETAHRGLVRHLYVRTNRAGAALVCLVVNAPAERALPDEAGLVRRLREALPGCVGVVLSSNTRRTNVILGDAYRTLWGSPTLDETLCGLTFRLSVPSFFQVNRDQCEVLYDRALAFAGLTGKETVLDLYCGIGTISLCAAKRAKRVVGAEIVPEAIEDAKANAARNSIENAEFFCGDAGDTASMLARQGVRPDVVIVDPPRRGLEPSVIDTVAQMAPERLVYVSCDPATLARDVKLFSARGYQAEKAEAVDMFPRTLHVETVVQLSKGEIQSKKIRVDFSLEDMDMSGFQKGATYGEIKTYVKEHTGLTVSSLYIAQVKQKCGIIERENYNKPKSEDSRQPQCPPEKEAAIRAALEYFRMI